MLDFIIESVLKLIIIPIIVIISMPIIIIASFFGKHGYKISLRNNYSKVLKIAAKIYLYI